MKAIHAAKCSMKANLDLACFISLQEVGTTSLIGGKQLSVTLGSVPALVFAKYTCCLTHGCRTGVMTDNRWIIVTANKVGFTPTLM